ncbi:putative chitinase-like, partial [Homarus americanus]
VNFISLLSDLSALHANNMILAVCQADFAVNYWIDGGMPSTKIALVYLCSRCWKLNSNTDEHGYYAPASHQDLQDPTPGVQEC